MNQQDKAHHEIDQIEREIARIHRMSRQEMADDLGIMPTRRTYFYVNTDGHLDAIEKPYTDTSPGDEGKSIGYWRRLV